MPVVPGLIKFKRFEREIVKVIVFILFRNKIVERSRLIGLCKLLKLPWYFELKKKKKITCIFQIFNLESWKDCSISFFYSDLFESQSVQIVVIKSTGKMKRKKLFLNASRYDFILSILCCELKFVYSPLNDLRSIVESRGISFALSVTWFPIMPSFA